MLTREYGAIATYVTEKGETPLMKAAANGHWEVCKFLIDERAKVNQMDENSQTAVMWAAAEGHFDCTKGLLENEAKVRRLDLIVVFFGKDQISFVPVGRLTSMGNSFHISATLHSSSNFPKNDAFGHGNYFAATAGSNPWSNDLTE